MSNHDALGKAQERKIVRWGKTHGFPHADRIVRTGAGKNYGHRADEGDLWLCPGVVVQSKRLSPVNRMERAVPIWLEQTEAQRVAANADVGLLVVRREGCGDVGQWWAWLDCADLWMLLGGTFAGPPPEAAFIPLRLQVDDVARLLRAYGYGHPLPAVTSTTPRTWPAWTPGATS